MSGSDRKGLTALLLLALSGCGGRSPQGAGWTGSVALRGDTTIVTSRTPIEPHSIIHDSVELLWGQDSLERAIGPVLTSGGELVVADGTHLFLLSIAGHLERTIGRAGEGPGEFGEINNLGVAGDTILAGDFEQRRITLFDTAGKVLALHPFPRIAELANPLPGRIVVTARGLLLGLNSIIFLAAPRPVYGSAVLAGWQGDTATELVRVMGQRYQFKDGDVSTEELFGRKPIIAISSAGMVASTDGMNYCIDVRGADSVARRRFCRDWTPVAVTEAVRHPDLDRYAAVTHPRPGWVAEMRPWLAAAHIGAVRNSIDRMLWDGLERLWVRVEDSLDADVHPRLQSGALELLPARAHWDLFAPDGKLLVEEYLPRRFTPYDGDEKYLYGIYELASGEVAVARVAVLGADQADRADTGEGRAR